MSAVGDGKEKIFEKEGGLVLHIHKQPFKSKYCFMILFRTSVGRKKGMQGD